jgi:hypothetical protein
MADLYRVTLPDQPVLIDGNTLCKGKPVAYLIVLQHSEKTWKEADPRMWVPFPARSLPQARQTTAGVMSLDHGTH